MPILTDVSNFQVNNDCVFTWDSVLDAEYYELRHGADWATGTKVNGVGITSLQYQLTEGVAGDYFIKAFADGYDESAVAATVNLVAAPVLTDPANVTIVADALTFDLVPDATSYEIRASQGYADTPGDSALILIVADNNPILIPNNTGKRFYVRALGNCLSKSPGYGTYFSEFDTNDDCGQVETPNGVGFLKTLQNIGAGVGLFKQKTINLVAELKTIVAGTNVTITEGPDSITINAAGGGGGVNPLLPLTVDTDVLLGGTRLVPGPNFPIPSVATKPGTYGFVGVSIDSSGALTGSALIDFGFQGYLLDASSTVNDGGARLLSGIADPAANINANCEYIYQKDAAGLVTLESNVQAESVYGATRLRAIVSPTTSSNSLRSDRGGAGNAEVKVSLDDLGRSRAVVNADTFELGEDSNKCIPIFPAYTVATLPTVDGTTADGVIIVSDEVGGRTLAIADSIGANWRRVSDGVIVS